MANEDLVNYIKAQKASGVPDEQIRSALLANGWGEDLVKEVFGIVSVPIPEAKDMGNGFSGVSTDDNPTPTGGNQAVFSETDQAFGSVAQVSSGGQSGTLPLMPIEQMLHTAWSLSKERIKIFLLISLFPMLGFLLFIPVIIVAYISPIFAIVLGVIVFIIVVVISALSLLAQTITIISVRPLGIKEAFSISKQKFFPYLWLSFLSSFLILGASFFFIIPGIIFAIWFSQATYIMIEEDKRGFTALMASKELLRGRLWDVILRWLVIFGVSAAISSVFSVIYLLTSFMDMLVGGIPIFSAIPYLAYLAVSWLAGVFALAFYVLMYRSLKNVKDSFEVVVTSAKKAKYFAIGCLGSILMVVSFVAIIAGLSFLFSKVLTDVNMSNPTPSVLKNIEYGSTTTKNPYDNAINQIEEATKDDKSKANDAERKADLARIQTVLEDCYGYVGVAQYPASLAESCVVTKFSEGVVPRDPKSRLPYNYVPSADLSSYKLSSVMDYEKTGTNITNGALTLTNKQ